jgi:hypothetical protein
VTGSPAPAFVDLAAPPTHNLPLRRLRSASTVRVPGRWVRVVRFADSRLRAVLPRLVAAAALGGAAVLGVGCESAKRPVRPDVDLHHPSASRRLEAVGAVARSRDTSQVPALFDRLLDDDEAVRLAAAAALRDLVGRDPGYRAYDAEGERAAKAAAWRAAWQGAGSPARSSSSLGGPGSTGGAVHGTPR